MDINLLLEECEVFNNLEEDVFHDGEHCPYCHDKGYIKRITEDMQYTVVEPCKCRTRRLNRKKLKAQGLEKQMDRCRFENFETTKPFQKVIFDKATRFAKEPKGWFGIFGQSGAGKTTICVTILNVLIDITDKECYYCRWVDLLQKLNANVNDQEYYDKLMNEVKNVDILYIDDFFKPTGANQMPTPAEVRKAFDIIDYRGSNDKITLISGERTIDEMCAIDEATTSRIFEMCGENLININRDKTKNFRFRGIEL